MRSIDRPPASTGQGESTAPEAKPRSRCKGALRFHTDHLGSTHYTTNNVQTLIQHEEYFPSGELWKHESDSLYELAQRFTFSGKDLDLSTGLYDFGARSYDARQGQWLSPDPILVEYMGGGPATGVYTPGNLCLYGYSWNNPVNIKDPDGRCPECTFSALRETPGESQAINSGLANLAQGMWNSIVRKASATVVAVALGRPAWAPPPTQAEIAAAHQVSGAAAIEDVALIEGVPVEAEIGGEVILDALLMSAGSGAGTAAKVESTAARVEGAAVNAEKRATSAGTKMVQQPVQQQQARHKPGQMTGGSGKPVSPTVKHESRKRALDAAQSETAKGFAPEHHPAQGSNPPHFHAVDSKGELKPKHHDYPE